MLAFHRDFVCGVPYGVSILGDAGDGRRYAFVNSLENENYFYFIVPGDQCAVSGLRGNSYAGVTGSGGLIMQGNFYDVKLFEVVE
nr:MAG TPA: hypothetical protein [Caudoviricetes sp.]